MEIKVTAKFVRNAPRKVSLLTNLIRGVDVKEALARLEFTNKLAAFPVIKLIKSAIANAKENYGLDEANLFIKDSIAGAGPVLKRYMPKAFGRATPIRKRMSHITIILGERVPTDVAKITKKKSIDNIVTIGAVDELKAIENDKDIKEEKKDITKKVKKTDEKGSVASKGFVGKIFNRKSGEK